MGSGKLVMEVSRKLGRGSGARFREIQPPGARARASFSLRTERTIDDLARRIRLIERGARKGEEVYAAERRMPRLGRDGKWYPEDLVKAG